jgi:hypothetical protein
VSAANVSFGNDSPGSVSSVTLPGFIAEPGSATSDTLTVKEWDSCMGAGENYAVNAVRFTVLGFE